MPESIPNSEPANDGAVEILCVDDEPANLLALEAILDRPDYALTCVQSADEALRAILDHEYAVILLDVRMPSMDGFELASIIKSHPRYATIPILFVTATPGDRRRIFEAYRVGAVDYLEKPVDEDVVRSKVAVFVDLFRKNRRIRQQSDQLREMELARLRTESARRYRNLAEAIPQVVMIARPSGDAEFLNERWEAATRRRLVSSLGRGWRAAVHPDDLEAFDDAWADANRTREPMQIEVRLGNEARGFRWHLFRACPEIEDGAITRWLGTFTDVDDHKRAEEEARAAVAQRDEFLSIASHELRTPLTPLLLELQALERAARKGESLGSDVVAKRVASTTRQALRLKSLVDTLLDVSALTHSKVVLSREECDLGEIARDVCERFAEPSARVNSKVTLVVQAPVIGEWDRLRIEQVVTNLLANAVKYAAGTTIEVKVGAVDGEAILVVRDRGIGIAPERLPKIFERFERGVSSSNYGGLGLGLYIVQQIVEAHGGGIRVESRPNEGAAFTVTLPRRVDLPQAAAR